MDICLYSDSIEQKMKTLGLNESSNRKDKVRGWEGRDLTTRAAKSREKEEFQEKINTLEGPFEQLYH
jgi:hypothetical protein